MNNFIRKAFTLIELLVVIAIVGILSGLIIVGMNSSIQSATIAKAQVFSTSLRDSLLMSLVSEWKFDGTTADGSPATNNDVLDAWSYANNGTVSATPPTVKTGSNCVYGSCLQFNGTNTYIDCGGSSSLNITGQLTISAWINQTRDAQSWQYIVSNDRDMSPPPGGFSMRTQGSNNRLVGYIWKNSTSTLTGVLGSVVPQGAWHYAVFTFNGTNLTVYQNGVQSGTATIAADTIQTAPYHLIIGAMAHSVPGYFRFNGLIDEVRIYNAAIPASQIRENYYAGLNKMLQSGIIDNGEYSLKINNLIN